MDDKAFADLLKSVRQMGTHMRGKSVRGVRVTEFTEPEPRAVREASSATSMRRNCSGYASRRAPPRRSARRAGPRASRTAGAIG